MVIWDVHENTEPMKGRSVGRGFQAEGITKREKQKNKKTPQPKNPQKPWRQD